MIGLKGIGHVSSSKHSDSDNIHVPFVYYSSSHSCDPNAKIYTVVYDTPLEVCGSFYSNAVGSNKSTIYRPIHPILSMLPIVTFELGPKSQLIITLQRVGKKASQGKALGVVSNVYVDQECVEAGYKNTQIMTILTVSYSIMSLTYTTLFDT